LVLAATVPAFAQTVGAPNCNVTSVGLTPLTDFEAGRYEGFRGGLYPNGRNHLPKPYRELGLKRATQIQPLDPEGTPDPDGQVVLLSVGMSNTAQEFSAFTEKARSDPRVDQHVAIVNGAQGGFDAGDISRQASTYWKNVEQILSDQGSTAAQVQVVWLKEAIAFEDRAFPEDAGALRDDLREIVEILRSRFPNLRIVYVSSRTYAGYATTDLNPEPFAYESAFAVKWLIGKDIRSETKEKPWLAWGPYLWTDGTAGRADGFVWECSDVAADGTHPSASGEQKVADLLLEYMTTRATAESWFVD
jgi:hypothetical protein